MRRGLMAAAIIGGVLAHNVVLMVIFVIAAWAVGVYFWPFAHCWRCHGRKVNRGSVSKRWGLCKQCGGTGSRQVIGSMQVHKAVLAARTASSIRKRSS